jgi:para-aminobenzoate synthetase component 1
VPALEPCAFFTGTSARDLVEVSADPAVLDGGGRWAVAIGFEGETVLARFRDWRRESAPQAPWEGVSGPWGTSMSREQYLSGVHRIQEHIGRGWVYQVNLCRVLSARCEQNDLLGLYAGLVPMEGAFAGFLYLPEHGVDIASASPERFLSRAGGSIWSSPIKGTADHPDRFLAKDRAENIMIVDLVRNDLGRVATTGSVGVRQLLAVEPYPGLYHLVSTVTADVTGRSWQDILSATMPPGSVSGAPKFAALQVIEELEPVRREWYCGAFGWIDADTGHAELGVAIRTFWLRGGELHFGTGAGITWGSDPAGEWQETVLKARRLIGIADSVAR